MGDIDSLPPSLFLQYSDDLSICQYLHLADENLLSHPDTGIARAAKDEQRMLMTLDIEFADLRKYPPGSHPGVILFRPLSLSPLLVNDFIADFVRRTNLDTLAACVAVVIAGLQ